MAAYGIALVLACLAVALPAEAQQARVHRVGVILHGGSYFSALDGLRDGLREQGLEEGAHYVLHVRETGGDLRAVSAAATRLEAEKVDLIYTLASSVTQAAARATTSIPIVFYAGNNPVSMGLVESFRRPGGRLTGVHGRFTDLAAKRLQLLREMLPGLRRVVTFYNPGNPAAAQAIKIGRASAAELAVELVERPVGSVEELRAGLNALRPGEADAFFYVADAMMTGQAQLIIDIATTKNLPTMFADRESAAKGALASYGVSYYAFGKVSAKHVHRVLGGADPAELPVEQLDRLFFVVNLRTAKALNLSIPQSVLIRADELIQ